MAGKRFGGAHSPGRGGAKSPPVSPLAGQPVRSGGFRTGLMFILPTPLILSAIFAVGGSAVTMAANLAAYGALMLGAWLLREGQRAEVAYHARAIARPPAFPRKTVAAGLAGLGVAGASWLGAESSGLGAILNAAFFGALAAGAHVAAFGLDPMSAKGDVGNLSAAERDRVTDAIDKAEEKLATIETTARSLRDREISDRVRALTTGVREMIRLVEEDPRDLGRARRYLGVYLKGAEDATLKYASNHKRLDAPEIRESYLGMLDELHASFERGKGLLLVDDRVDLEVEIEVLRDRLNQEGA